MPAKLLSRVQMRLAPVEENKSQSAGVHEFSTTFAGRLETLGNGMIDAYHPKTSNPHVPTFTIEQRLLALDNGWVTHIAACHRRETGR